MNYFAGTIPWHDPQPKHLLYETNSFKTIYFSSKIHLLDLVNQISPNPNFSKKFGDLTYCNKISFTIDGEETFRMIYEKLSAAIDSICIAGYDFDPKFKLIRNADHNNHRVRNSSNSRNKKTYRVQDLLLQKAKEGIMIRILIWQPRKAIRILPGAKNKGMDDRTDNILEITKKTKDLGLQRNLIIRLDKTAPTLTAGHHEKIIIIDNKVGFCGGSDLSIGKWDNSDHNYKSDLRDRNTGPWHDVHAMFKGSVVNDLIYHFEQRWNYSQSRDIKSVKALKFPTVAYSKKTGTQIVALRTWNKINPVSDILKWYHRMFKNAKYGIYIENQFPFQYKPIVKLLENRIKKEHQLQVIIVMPIQPNLPGLARSIITQISINEILNNLQRLREISPERVKTYCLVSQDSKVQTRRRQIYVHSKLMIVDDKWTTIGSANLDKNGLKDSTEFNLGITSTKLARELRTKLWCEHLGMENENVKHRKVIRSFHKGFALWHNAAERNGKRALDRLPLTGPVYYFNFEEMKYPAPYKKAEGANKFQLV